MGQLPDSSCRGANKIAAHGPVAPECWRDPGAVLKLHGMKYRLLLVLGPVVALAMPAVLACSSSDSGTSSPDGGGTGGTSGSGGSSGAAGASGSAGAAGAASGKCTLQSDQTALDACYNDGGVDTPQDIAKQCGIDCLVDKDPSACTLTCLQAATNHAITDACSSCIVASVECGKANCLTPCLGSDAAKCNTCLCGGAGNTNGVNCIDEYVKCSGRPNTTCTTGPTTCPH